MQLIVQHAYDAGKAETTAMGGAALQMLRSMIAAAVMPTRIIMVSVLLRGKDGLAVTATFVAGMASVRLVQGAFFGFLADSIDTSARNNDPGTVVTVVLLIIGVLMLVTAVRVIAKEDNPDAPPPKWMSALQGLSPIKACESGALLLTIAAIHWVFTPGALSIMAGESIDQPGSTATFLIFVLDAELVVLAPLAAYVVAPKRSLAIFESAGDWLEAHNDQIMIIVSGVFGAYFQWKSLTNLHRSLHPTDHRCAR